VCVCVCVWMPTCRLLVMLRYIENIKISIRCRYIVSYKSIAHRNIEIFDILVSTFWYIIILPNFHVLCQEVVKFSRNKRKRQPIGMLGRRLEAVATMIGCLPTQALAFLAVFVYAPQAIAFEWKPGFTVTAHPFGIHVRPRWRIPTDTTECIVDWQWTVQLMIGAGLHGNVRRKANLWGVRERWRMDVASDEMD